MSKVKKDIQLKEEQQVIAKIKKENAELMFNGVISEEQKAILAERVVNDVVADETARAGLFSRLKDIIDVYEGKTQAKREPFQGCANVNTMVTAMVVELLHSKLYPMIYNENLTYFKPQASEDISSVEPVTKWMKYSLRSCDFGDYVSDTLKCDLLYGTKVTKVRWIEEYKWVQRKIPRVEAKANKFKNVMFNLFGQQKKVKIADIEEYEVKYEYKKFVKCIPELLSLDDVGFPVNIEPIGEESKMEHIWHRTRPTVNELEQNGKLGFFENIDKVKAFASDTMPSQSGTLSETTNDAMGVKLAAELGSNKGELIEWYGIVNIPGKGDIQCIAWIEKQSKTFLGIMPLLNISRINQRPIFIGQFVKRLFKAYGRGIADFVVELQKEMDTIHNQRLDLASMTIIPPSVFRAGAMFNPDKIKMAPGISLPLDDINDFKWMPIPNNALVSFQEEKLIMEIIESVTSIGSYQSGQESPTNRTKATARGTLAIINQGEQRQAMFAVKEQKYFARVIRYMLSQYQEKMPREMGERLLGDDAEIVFPRGLTPEDIAGNFDVYMELDVTGGSKSVERETQINLYNLMAANPFVQANIGGFYELSSDTLKAAGKVDVERYLGPKPIDQQQIAKTVDDEIALMKQGTLPVTKEGDNPIVIYMGLQDFVESEEYQELPIEKKKLVDIRLIDIEIQMAKTVQALASQRGAAMPQGEPESPDGEQVPAEEVMGGEEEMLV